MTTEEIKILQEKVGAYPDGDWGPKSKAACRKYLRSLCPNNPWPKDTVAALNKFFGYYGEPDSVDRRRFLHNQIVNLNVEKYGFKYAGKKVKTIRCHRLIAPSLTEIFDEIIEAGYGYIFNEYNGCLEIRPRRGGTEPSRHSWGIAIDFMASSNGLKTPWPTKADMPFEVICIFAKYGFMSYGAIRGVDGMHFQAVTF